MIMKKRGLSDVVTTVLLILLVLAAVIIVWAFVRVFILDNSAKIDTGVFNVGFSIPSKNVVITEDNNITFKLTRSAGEAELEAVNVIIEDNEGNRVVKRIDGSINELGSKTINIKLYEHNLTSIKRIAVAPIVLNKDGNEIIGNEAVSYKIKGDEEGSILASPAPSCTGSETQSCSGSNECKNYQQTCSAGTWGTCTELGNKIDGTSCSTGVCVVGSCQIVMFNSQAEFSFGTQGENNWYYYRRSLSTGVYSLLQWTGPAWGGSADGILGQTYSHPAPNYDAVRAWNVSIPGNIVINVSIRDGDNGVGDGINYSIYKNSEQLYFNSFSNGFSANITNTTSVNVGDVIYFWTDKKVETDYDTTLENIGIIYF